MPKVSIVLPVYNGERYIRESIDSILGQIYKNWELIIVNDCSTDSTGDIIREFEKKDSRIRVIHNDINKKLPNSLNVGFRHASGEYLTWTSDDNSYLPDALAAMVGYLEREKDVYMVTGAMETMDDNGRVTGKWPPYDDKYIYYSNCVGACFMYRSSIIEEIGEYNPDMFLVEDYDYWLRILSRYGEIGSITDILYRYRNHSKSLTLTRQTEIKRQLAILRTQYIDTILVHLKDDKGCLCCMYYDFLDGGGDMENVSSKIKKLVPELVMDVKYDCSKDTIIYGAGQYGYKALKRLDGKVSYFADRDLSKVGLYKNGIEIISVNEMARKSGQYQVVVAVSNEKIYEVLSSLMKNGVRTCCVLQNIRRV